MAYEVESLPTSITVNAGAPKQSVMREEKTVNPYHAAPVTKPGQSDTVKESAQAPVDPGSPVETVRLSPQVAALARREQKFRQQQQTLEKDRAALAAEKAEIAQLRAMKEKLAAKDYSGLDGLVDYNEYSQYQVNRLNGIDPTQEELKKLQTEISEIKKSSQDSLEKQFEAAVSERRLAAQELVSKSTEFPRIKKANAHEAVVQHILDTWEHDSQEISVEQAAKEVEMILVEKAKQWATLLEEEKIAEDPKKQLPPLKQGLRTLTNQVTTTGEVKRPQKSLHFMSDQDRWNEARRRVLEKQESS